MEPEARNSTSDEVKIPNSLKDGFEAMAGFSLPSETVKLLAESSIKMLLQVEAAKQTEMSNDKDGETEAVKYCLMSLYTIATKHNLDGVSLQQLIETQFTFVLPEIRRILVEIYEKYRNELYLKFSSIGNSVFPHVTDIRWRQMTTVKSSVMNVNSHRKGSDGEVSFLINMGYFNERTYSSSTTHSPYLSSSTEGERKTVAEFVCNTEEMQLLINKLKEVQRHCVKFSNE